jgi:hypothetical protein
MELNLVCSVFITIQWKVCSAYRETWFGLCDHLRFDLEKAGIIMQDERFKGSKDATEDYVWEGTKGRYIFASKDFVIELSEAQEFGSIEHVIWLNDDAHVFNRTAGMRYGNEFIVQYHYCSLVILFAVDSFKSRSKTIHQ